MDNLAGLVQENKINPFKTDKTATSGNLRLCLKWKPQAKCH